MPDETDLQPAPGAPPPASSQQQPPPDQTLKRAIDRFGEQVSTILQQAYDQAGEIIANAEREAAQLRAAAGREAAEISARAEERVRELDLEADRIWAERERLLADARQLGERLFALVQESAARFPAEAPPAADVALSGAPGSAPAPGPAA